MLVRAIQEVKSISEIPSSALVDHVLFGSKLREARLITNLLRVKYLMQFIGIEQQYILQIENLSSIIIMHDWPGSMHLFNRNQGSPSNY